MKYETNTPGRRGMMTRDGAFRLVLVLRRILVAVVHLWVMIAGVPAVQLLLLLQLLRVHASCHSCDSGIVKD